MEKQPIMQTIREVAENPAVIAGSALFAAIAVKGALFPGAALANVAPVAAVAEDKTCDAFTTYPCDTGQRFSIEKETDVRFCQDQAIGLDNYDEPGLIKHGDVSYRIGSEKVTVEYTIDGMESWRNKAFSGTCAEVTDNSSTQKVVRLAGKEAEKINPSTGFVLAPNSDRALKYKSVSKSQTVQGPTNTAFVSTHARTEGDFVVKRTFMMDKPLTAKNVEEQNVCIRGMVFSRGKQNSGVKSQSAVSLACVRPDQVKGYSKKH